MTEENFDWIMCPNCYNPSPAVAREVGDRGETESYNIVCGRCLTATDVIP